MEIMLSLKLITLKKHVMGGFSQSSFKTIQGMSVLMACENEFIFIQVTSQGTTYYLLHTAIRASWEDFVEFDKIWEVK